MRFCQALPRGTGGRAKSLWWGLPLYLWIVGQANVKHWVDGLLPLLTDEDPLGVDAFATHHMTLEDGPTAYQVFQDKEGGMIRTLLKP